MSELWKYEHIYAEQGCKLVCGVDEAGRGPLAGPVCAAAVILPMDLEIEGLNDSKKLTEKRRRRSMISLLTRRLPMALRLQVKKKLTRSIFCKQHFWRCAVRSNSFS